MKRMLLLLLVLAAGAVQAEPTLDEILDQNIEARGGYEAWKSIDSAHMTGRMLMGGGIEAPFRLWFKRPDKVRMEFDVQGMTGVQAFDGETGWYVMPFMGKTEPEAMADDQLKDIKEMADFDGILVDWEEKGHSVELVGTEDVEGTPTYRLDVTKANGDENTIFLDQEYFLEIKTTAKTERQGNEVIVHTTIGDYKEVGDVIMPHSMEMQFEGLPMTQQLTIENVELNADVDDARFDMPEAATSGE